MKSIKILSVLFFALAAQATPNNTWQATPNNTWFDAKDQVEWRSFGMGTFAEAVSICKQQGSGWGLHVIPSPVGFEYPYPDTPWNTAQRINESMYKSPLFTSLQREANSSVVRYWMDSPALRAITLRRKELLLHLSEVKMQKAKVNEEWEEVEKQRALSQKYSQELEAVKKSFYIRISVELPSYAADSESNFVLPGSPLPVANIVCRNGNPYSGLMIIDDENVWINPNTGTRFNYLGQIGWDQSVIDCWKLGGRLPAITYGSGAVKEDVEELKALFQSQSPFAQKLLAHDKEIGPMLAVWGNAKSVGDYRGYYYAPLTNTGDVRVDLTFWHNSQIHTVCMTPFDETKEK